MDGEHLEQYPAWVSWVGPAAVLTAITTRSQLSQVLPYIMWVGARSSWGGRREGCYPHFTKEKTWRLDRLCNFKVTRPARVERSLHPHVCLHTPHQHLQERPTEASSDTGDLWACQSNLVLLRGGERGREKAPNARRWALGAVETGSHTLDCPGHGITGPLQPRDRKDDRLLSSSASVCGQMGGSVRLLLSQSGW